jgi:putative protease
MTSCELLAPAGDLEAAYAAFHYGADAIYLGLRQFSARAEASNFDLDELSEIVAFAHAATPRRSVYVAFNTLLREAEVDRAIEVLAAVSDVGADALIVQDLGVVRLVRRYFPKLALHASTQLAIHNLEGARTARELGFHRVTLARELTRPEIAAIAGDSGLEVEVFVHGALCYSYSGLCLYSSLLRGRSGNRGRCTYPCRECFSAATGTKPGFLFSMKDLALPEAVQGLRQAGVKSLKIEGRKKSALYVATTTDYYRKLLDGRLSNRDRETAEEAIRTVFSRPWTGLYVASRKNRDVVDTEVVGHRGAWIGTVERVDRNGWLRFRTRRRLERHDGIQIDIPGEGRPFGFAVDHLCLVSERGGRNEVFEAPAQALVETSLPADHPPVKEGARLYCSSSQQVKQQYRFPRPKPGAFRVRKPVDITLIAGPDRITAIAVCGEGGEGGERVEARVEEAGAFAPSRNPAATDAAGRQAFEKLGDTAFVLKGLKLRNPDGLFVPVSTLNRLRREVAAALAESVAAVQHRGVLAAREQEKPAAGATAPGGLRWSLKTDRLAHLEAFEPEDWREVGELVLDIACDSASDIGGTGAAWAQGLGPDKVRMAVPMMAREWELKGLREKIVLLNDAGWKRWEAAGLAAWQLLRECGCGAALGNPGGLTSDWPVYVTNRTAARQVLEMGCCRFTLSPDDDFENARQLLAGFGAKATVIVYQDTPLFISENCAMASAAGSCPAGARCRDSETPLTSGSGERVRVIQKGCRTVVINESPLDWSRRLDLLSSAGAGEVRADFVNRRYSPQEVRDTWRLLRAGTRPPGWEGNFSRPAR